MAITFSCPDCKAPVTTAHDAAGERISCPKCGAFLTVPHASAPEQVVAGPPPTAPTGPPALPSYIERVTERDPYAEQEFGRDEGRRYEGREHYAYPEQPIHIGINRGGWNLVRIGLAMMYWSIIAIFLAIVPYMMIALTLLAGGLVGRWEDVGPVLVIVLLGGVLALIVVAGVGQCMCCAAPPESGARGLAIGSAICLGLTVVGLTGFAILTFGMIGFEMHGGGLGPNPTVLILMALLFLAVVGIASHVLFVSFLRGVGRYFHNYDLVQSGGNYLILYFLLFGLNLVTTCLQRGLGQGRGDETLGGCMSLVVLVMGIVAVVWYLRLIGTTRQTVTNAMRDSGD